MSTHEIRNVYQLPASSLRIYTIAKTIITNKNDLTFEALRISHFKEGLEERNTHLEAQWTEPKCKIKFHDLKLSKGSPLEFHVLVII